MSYTGKTIWVTGASAGIALETFLIVRSSVAILRLRVAISER